MEGLSYSEAKLLNTALLNMMHDIRNNVKSFIYTNEELVNVVYTEDKVRKLRAELLVGYGFDL